MRGIPIVISALFLAACASQGRVQQTESAREIVRAYTEASAIPISRALQTLSSVEPAVYTKSKIFINPASAKLVDFGSYMSPALLIERKENQSELILRSYVVQSVEPPLYLFYPIITALDQDGRPISEILPESEFKFYDNVLTNEFKIPNEAEHLLIHTSPAFTGMSFNETASRSSGSVEIIGIGVASAFAGPVGGAIYTAANSSAKAPEEREGFVFSVGGSITIELGNE